MKRRVVLTLIFALCSLGQVIKAQEFFIYDSNGNLGVVNFNTCAYRLIPINSGLSIFPDITFHPNGKLYVYGGAAIYELDTLPNSSPRLIAQTTGIKSSSLTTDVNGIMYGAYTQLWSFNLATNQFKVHGDLMAEGQPITASGDLTFYNGELFVSTTSNTLVKVNIEDPTQSSTFMSFPSAVEVYGIVSFKDCGKTKTYATTSGAASKILEIDWKNKTSRAVCSVPVEIFGAASRYEYLASKSDTTFIDQYTCDSNQVKSVTQILKNSENCDSTVTNRTIYRGSKPTIINVPVCNLNEIKPDTIRLTNIKGCDSLVIKIGVFNENITILSQTICTSDSFYFGNQYYKQTGSYYYSYPRPLKCDSIVNLKLSLKPRPTKTTDTWVCESVKVRLDTVKAGSLSVCDTVYVRNYRLAPRTQDALSFDKNICFNEKYLWNTQTLDKTGAYKAQFKNIYGCDSLITLNLIVLKKDSIYQEKATCNKQLVGIKTDTLKNKQGCDSIVVTKYTLKNEVRFTQKRNLCEGMSLVVGDTTYKTNGIYIKILKNTEGCDSIVTTELSITSIDLTMPNDTVVNLGDSIQLVGISQTTLPVKWQWTPNTYVACDTCNATWIKPLTPVMYRLAVYDTLSKCRKEGTVYIRPKTDCATYVPNAFSPNDDGINDKLKIYLSKCVKRVKRYAVYNRWGNAIIETSNNNGDTSQEVELWDGLIEGKVAAGEVYVYYVEVEYINGQSAVLKGDVNLMR